MDHVREHRSVLASAEKRLLIAIARRLPGWLSSDHLTLLGLLAMPAAGLAFAAIPITGWAAPLFALALAINWFGDSLDGTLARVRRHERPRYGFYLDHLTDAYSTTAVGLGLGFSPYMLLSVGLAIVIAYLVLSINVYLETHAFGVFRYGYGILGPTEARAVLFVLNVVALVTGPLPFSVHGLRLTAFDVAGALAALSMGGLLLRRVVRNLRELARLEPAGGK